MTAKSKGNSHQLSEREFVERAIRRLRKPDKLGIHAVFSGFNDAFRRQFNRDPFETIRWLEKEGVIKTRFSKRGPWLYLPEDWETEQLLKKEHAADKRISNALAKILSDE